MNELVFACHAVDLEQVKRAAILTESIRAFAGDYSAVPVWVLVPEAGVDLSAHFPSQLDTKLIPFDLEPQVASFPFATKVVASATAEAYAINTTSQLVWMDSGSMVVNSPQTLILEKGLHLGCRPVDHLLIGSPYEAPVDNFWSAVYHVCGVDQSHIFPMRTSADQVKIRPYINAGMLVVRPEHGLLQRWRDKFLTVYQDPRFLDIYQQGYLYQLFMHQAILAGCILSTLGQGEISELPFQVNYPLHMHSQYPSQSRPRSINELVSFRYEDFFSDPAWLEQIRVDDPLKDWLLERVSSLSTS